MDDNKKLSETFSVSAKERRETRATAARLGFRNDSLYLLAAHEAVVSLGLMPCLADGKIVLRPDQTASASRSSAVTQGLEAELSALAAEAGQAATPIPRGRKRAVRK